MDHRWGIFQLSLLFAVFTAHSNAERFPLNEPCTTSTGYQGSCVYQYQCENGFYVVHGENIIDIRMKLDNCDEYMLVCCTDVLSTTTPSDVIAPPPSTSDGQNNGTGTTGTGSVVPTVPGFGDLGSISAEEPQQNTDEDNSVLPATTTPATSVGGTSPSWNLLNASAIDPVPENKLVECGHGNSHGVIFGIKNNELSESEYGEYPWTVAIFTRQQNNSLKYLCGGALIESSAILTTASCVRSFWINKAQLVVRLGEWDMSTVVEPIAHVDIEAETVHLHPQYSLSSHIHDIAVVILREAVELGHTIGVVCLPSVSQSPAFNRELFGAGWGDVPSFVVPKKLPQTILKKAQLSVISNADCQHTMRRLMGRRFTLHDSFLCANAADTEMLPCRGDSGSPYVMEIEGTQDRFYLTGLSTWGYDCNKQHIPTVLTNVAHHREWIDEVINKESLSTWSYTYAPSDNEEE